VRHTETLHVVAHNSQQQEQAQRSEQQPSHDSRLKPPSISPLEPTTVSGDSVMLMRGCSENGQSVLVDAVERPLIRLRGPVLDAGAAEAALDLASFYERLLGWPIVQSAPGGWALLESPDGLKIEIQGSSEYQPPTWPTRPGEQQMMLHVDFASDDLDAAVKWAIEAGASVADHQPQPNVRVMVDPAGHPFCLFHGAV
jgi:predicted enzyme related to lactoylglutathione lyase